MDKTKKVAKETSDKNKSSDKKEQKNGLTHLVFTIFKALLATVLLELMVDLFDVLKHYLSITARVAACIAITAVIWIYFPSRTTEPTDVSKNPPDWLPMDEWSLMDRGDQRLIDFIKKNHLLPPSTQPYDLKEPEVSDYSQNGQSMFIDELLQHKTNGTFIEAGAYDGEYLSNSLFFEKTRGWTGLLVEADPWNHYSLMKRHRKAYTMHAGVSPSRHLMKARFKQSGETGRIAKEEEVKGIFTQVTFFPLYSIMKSIDRTDIDVLFLDIEGAELQVLKTIPWVLVSIEVICVEYKHNPNEGEGLIPYLQDLGYTFVKTIGHDHIFEKGSSHTKQPT